MNGEVSWCAFLFYCLRAIEYNFRSFGFTRSAQGINAWLQVNKRNSQSGSLTNTSTRKGRPLSWKESFCSNSITDFLGSLSPIGTMNTEKAKGWMGEAVVVATSHTSTYRDSSVLLLQYPNGHEADKNPAKKSCDYGLKTLVICSKLANQPVSYQWSTNPILENI